VPGRSGVRDMDRALGEVANPRVGWDGMGLVWKRNCHLDAVLTVDCGNYDIFI